MGLRIAFTISGAVSLGAYEGGALAALVAALQTVCDGDDPPVYVDVVGGASAGSICALLTAWCLRSGLDPVAVFREAWVERADIAALRRSARSAPLNPEALDAIAESVLAPEATNSSRPCQRRPIRIRMALTPLRGLQYRIRSLEAGAPGTDGDDVEAVAAATFVDWCDFEIGPGTSRLDLTAPSGPVDAALASAANAWAFPPRWLDRTSVVSEYLANGITNLPETGGLWFTDGGTVDNEPIGRTLEVVGEADSDLDGSGGDHDRLLILVHPHPSSATPPDDWAWADSAEKPTWLAGALRALRIMTSQNVHDDLRRLEKVNTRLRWLDSFTETLAPVLDRLEDGARAGVTAALREVLDGIDADRASLKPSRVGGSGDGDGDGGPPGEGDPAELMRRIVSHIGGLRGKRDVRVDVISPRLVDPLTPVEGLLGGEILVRFGGFLDRELRLNDFRLGYASSLVWLRGGGLERHGVDPGVASEMVSAAESALPPKDRVRPDEFRRIGATTVRDLPARAKYELARVLAHISGVILRDLGND